MNVNIIEKSRVSWNAPQENENGYPGDENIKIGCLQRIATATEAMAQYHVRLLKDRDLYERWYHEERKSNQRMAKSNAALRGHIKRLKKIIHNQKQTT